MTPTLFLEFQGSENSVKEQAAVAGEQPVLLLMLHLVGHFEAILRPCMEISLENLYVHTGA